MCENKSGIEPTVKYIVYLYTLHTAKSTFGYIKIHATLARCILTQGTRYRAHAVRHSDN